MASCSGALVLRQPELDEWANRERAAVISAECR